MSAKQENLAALVAWLDAMRRARIRGALIGVEAVTPEGLKDVYKGFNVSGEQLVERLADQLQTERQPLAVEA